MIKHKPIPKTNVTIGTGKDKIEYECNAQGILELPDFYPQFNPIEEKPKLKRKKVKDEE